MRKIITCKTSPIECNSTHERIMAGQDCKIGKYDLIKRFKIKLYGTLSMPLNTI